MHLQPFLGFQYYRPLKEHEHRRVDLALVELVQNRGAFDQHLRLQQLEVQARGYLIACA